MIKDVCAAAASMLGRPDEAAELLSGDCSEELAREYLRLYSLVISEIAEEYRRGDEVNTAAATSLDGREAEFYGISGRVLAYGIAAERALTEGLDVAETWDTRYKSSLAMCARRPVRIKPRRFL